MLHELIIAGFGGQGVLFAGKICAYSAMISGLDVSWLPSYGPEMRGGTANCGVIMSDMPIGSPVVAHADTAIIMNIPSLDKFEDTVKAHGNIIIDSSLIEKKVSRSDVNAIYIPASEIAEELNAPKLSNMVLLGKFFEVTGVVNSDIVKKAIESNTPSSKAGLLELNIEAFNRGYNY